MTVWPALQGLTLPEGEPGLELLVVAAAGTTLIVGAAALADRFVRSAIWQRTVWQVATLGVLSLMFVELTGTGPALVRLWQRPAPAATRSQIAFRQTGQRPSAAAVPLPGEYRGFFKAEEYGPAAGAFAGPEGTVAAATVPVFSADIAADETQPAGQPALGPVEQPAPVLSGIVHEGTADAFSVVAPDIAAESTSVPASEASDLWWLGVIWATGAVAIAARAVYARALLSAFRRRGAAASDGPLCQRADRLARRLGIRRQVCMLEAPGLAAPVAFGSLRPVVALPVGFADELDARQQDAVLAHELAHLAAGDPAWQSVADLLCAALWWHPLAWWSRRRLRAASEAAADEASLIVPDGPGLLAGCLVALGRRLAEPAGAGWLSFGGSGFRSGLGRRVERLLDLRNRPWRAPGRGRMLLARTLVPVALVFQAISCTAWARPQVTLTEGGTTMSILTTSWQHSLAAAMLGWIAAGSAPAVSEAQPVENPAPAVVAAAPSDVQGQGPMAVQADQDSARQSAERQLQEAIQRALEAGQNQTGQFQAQIEEIERQSQQSQDDRFAGAIQELKRLADAVADELHAVEQDPAELEAHLQALIQLRDNLAKRAADLERRLAGMRQDDRVRQMQDLLARAHELAAGAETRVRRLAQRINAQPGQPEGPLPPNPDIEYLSRLLESQAAALRAAGRFDEAEAMQQEARDFFERAQPRPEPPPGSPEDFERRIHHVEVAIENLHAAGLHDQAERLVPQLDRLRIEREAAGRRRAAPVLRSSLPPVPPVQPTPPEMGQPVQQQQQRAIRELGAQVGQLRDEMAQLRQMLQELLQRDGPR